MPTCFIITPIGESGSETRRNADDLRDLLIKPVLESFGFQVVRGDHRSEAGQIDIDVIRAVQESDLCIADISLSNPNVYYEFGRRDETGKPLILLKAKNSDDLPVDIATRRYIEYDLDSRRGIIDAMEQLRAFVAPIVEKGFESSGTGASLSELAEILKRVERKIDRMETASESRAVSLGADSAGDPVDLLKLAMEQENIPMAEQAMEQLKYRWDRLRWLYYAVTDVASLGSLKAGDIAIQNAQDFMDSGASFEEKVEYFACLVSNLTRTDREIENQELVERLQATLLANSSNEALDARITVHNQLSRLYHGIYVTTKEKIWLEKAIANAEKTLKLNDNVGFLHYNLGLYLKEKNDYDKALPHLLRCVALEDDDADYLKTLCTLLHEMQDPRLMDYLDKLKVLDPVKAELLKIRFKK